jgi:hypothetical protein
MIIPYTTHFGDYFDAALVTAQLFTVTACGDRTVAVTLINSLSEHDPPGPWQAAGGTYKWRARKPAVLCFSSVAIFSIVALPFP